jgi:hypothetical protein
MKVGVSTLLPIAAAALLGGFAASATPAQSASEQNLKPTPFDRTAALEATVRYRHARPAQTEAGALLKQSNLAEARQRAASAAKAAPAEEHNDQIRFPADVVFNGGDVVEMAESHPIFLLPNGKCPIATCWGNPEQFLRDFAGSSLAHIADQYVHEHSSNRYTLGKGASISYTPTPKTNPLTDADIRGFVHAVAAKDGTGLNHIYHVFLPPGQDECFTSADTACYSPDNPSTFAFCGYHSSVTFMDIGDVLYSVEPFQDVPGCNVRPGTPNGQLVDSTNNTLSHELMETITDPHGDAWFNFTAVILAGAEIADECSFFVVLPAGSSFATFFDPSVFKMGTHRYAVQPEYNNEDHGCTVEP